jgi:hypothetical protein
MAEDLQEELGKNIPLSEMIQTLRTELQVALSAGAGQSVHFEVEKVDLELKVAVKRVGKAKGGVKFWVISIGGEVGGESNMTHTFKIALAPKTLAGGSLQVGGTTVQPPDPE